MNKFVKAPVPGRAQEELNVGDREDTGHDRRSALLTDRSYRLRQGLFKTICRFALKFSSVLKLFFADRRSKNGSYPQVAGELLAD